MDFIEFRSISFLADRTNGRAHATYSLMRLSVAVVVCRL